MAAVPRIVGELYHVWKVFTLLSMQP